MSLHMCRFQHTSDVPAITMMDRVEISSRDRLLQLVCRRVRDGWICVALICESVNAPKKMRSTDRLQNQADRTAATVTRITAYYLCYTYNRILPLLHLQPHAPLSHVKPHTTTVTRIIAYYHCYTYNRIIPLLHLQPHTTTVTRIIAYYRCYTYNRILPLLHV